MITIPMLAWLARPDGSENEQNGEFSCRKSGL
jgi:hypothetical protein